MTMTWEECAAAGMSQAEAARARGRSRNSASLYAKRTGLAFRDGRNDEAHAERSAERMRALNADPEFKKANAERSAERMRALNADPEFKKANAERSAERMRALNADPAVDMRHKHIRALDAAGLLDEYRALTRNGYSKAEALAALGVSA
jgi:hypothetical protein